MTTIGSADINGRSASLVRAGDVEQRDLRILSFCYSQTTGDPFADYRVMFQEWVGRVERSIKNVGRT